MIVVSGGDGFSIASALSGQGFHRLTEYVREGGLYVGICAGAYLPLRSSVEPFCEFNLSPIRIENIDCRLTQLENVPPRVAVRYGACSIVHPVRGELIHGHGNSQLLAPLYGGPIFQEPDGADVLMRYWAFTDRTEFQMPRRLAKSMILGKPSAVRTAFGKGALILLGPHLEHPKYPLANDVFLGLLGLPKGGTAIEERAVSDPRTAKAVADLKVAIVGLENRSFAVGKKLWDGSRYLELVDAISKRAHAMGDELASETRESLEKVRESLIRLNTGVESDVDETTALLVETARRCVDNHFGVLSGSR
jgi:hypothetical protein